MYFMYRMFLTVMEGLAWVVPLIRDNALGNILTLIGVIIIVNERKLSKAVQNSKVELSARRMKNNNLCNKKFRRKKTLRGMRSRTPFSGSTRH
jgi:hypothetical protein